MKILGIKFVETAVKENGVATGEKQTKVLISTAERDHWPSIGQFKNASGGSLNLNAFKGGDIEADYYEEGETGINGQPITASGIILRDLALEMNPVVVASMVAIEMKAMSTEIEEKDMLFRRRREERRARALTPENTEETTTETTGEPAVETTEAPATVNAEAETAPVEL